MKIHKDEENTCDCGCNRQLKNRDAVVIVTEGEVNYREECIDGLPDGAGHIGIYLKECYERMHPKPRKCPTCNGTGRTKPKQPCDNCEGTGFVNPMRLVQCFTSTSYCKRARCAIWDAAEARCSLLSIAVNTKRIGKEKL